MRLNSPVSPVTDVRDCSSGQDRSIYFPQSKMTLTRSVSEGFKSQSLADASGYDQVLSKGSFLTTRSIKNCPIRTERSLEGSSLIKLSLKQVKFYRQFIELVSQLVTTLPLGILN